MKDYQPRVFDWKTDSYYGPGNESPCGVWEAKVLPNRTSVLCGHTEMQSQSWEDGQADKVPTVDVK